MTTEVAVVKSFEERMMDMMKENAGNLFTPDDLKKIVEKGIEKMFFDKRFKQYSSYGYRDETKESLGEELIITFMKQQTTVAINNYIKENPEKVLELIEKSMKLGMTKFILDSINLFFQQSFFQFGESIKEQIRNMPR